MKPANPISSKSTADDPRDLFDRPEDAADFVRRTGKADNRSPLVMFWAVVLALFIIGLPLVIWQQFIRPLSGWPAGVAWWDRGVMALCLAAYTVICLRGYRQSVRRRMREELARRGVPTCPSCHYCLKDLTSNRCPECGRPIARRAD